MNFDSFKLHPRIAEGLKRAGYETPTPIQAQALPMALEGRDVLGLAQTGTGKTAAFALPILQKLIVGPRGKVRALVVAPTRELAEQIHTTFETLGFRTGLRSATVYGGVGMQKQEHALRGRAEIIVACPGRLLDHCDQRIANLTGVEVLVLDEADQMFDMGFLPSIRRIVALVPRQRQTLLFSATMPQDIRHLAHECLRDPATVQVDHETPLTTVTHALYPVKEHLKAALLLELLKHAGEGSVLVFTRTKHRAKKLGQRVQAAGYRAESLQGNLSQNRRKAVMDSFRDGSTQVLVATDIAARGIDVSQITHVINFDIPNTPEAYTHRIGRTGRAAKTGDAFTLVTDADNEMVRAIERRMGKPIERKRQEGFDYNKAGDAAPAHKPGGQHHSHGGQRHHQGGGQRQHSGSGQAPSGVHRPAAPSGHRGGGHRRRRRGPRLG
ncbi:MAG: DEAD/DEAH box helicase [Elusimicrobia bacterium]|nr:DEAD/DEAH box helicase [Elusimicrobiota bacterium]